MLFIVQMSGSKSWIAQGYKRDEPFKEVYFMTSKGLNEQKSRVAIVK